MEIKIETTCEEDLDKVAYFMRTFCLDNFRSFKLYIDGKEIKQKNGEEIKQK